jgi:hypothetical protein
MKHFTLGVLCIAWAWTSGVTGTVAQAQTSRPFSLGFTDYAYAFSQRSADWIWDTIARDGDLVTLHEEDAVPWPEALAQRYDLYHPSYMTYLIGRANYRDGLPSTHKVFLYLSMVNQTRTGLAGYRRERYNMPLPPPFDALSSQFSDARVIQAFVNHANLLISMYRPSYFAYAIEANMLLGNVLNGKAPADAWNQFVVGAAYVYYLLKAAHPTLPVFCSFQVDYFYQDQARQASGLQPLMPVTDFMAVSAYPFGRGYTISNLPGDYLTAIRSLAPSKPFAIAETGWPAEPVFYPDPLAAGQAPAYYVDANPMDQTIYMSHLLSTAESTRARFVNWFSARDYDMAWTESIQYTPMARLARLWKDIGLYDGNGVTRPSLSIWNHYKSRPLQ